MESNLLIIRHRLSSQQQLSFILQQHCSLSTLNPTVKMMRPIENDPERLNDLSNLLVKALMDIYGNNQDASGDRSANNGGQANTSRNDPQPTASKPKENEDEEVRTCVICLDTKAVHCLIPCGHICYCNTCITIKDLKPECPICRLKVQSTQKLFI